MNKYSLPNLRAYVIALSVPLAMILIASKVYGIGWLSLHPPEIEGGVEVTIENIKDAFFVNGQESKRIQDETRANEEIRRFEEQMENGRREHEERVREMERADKENKEWLESFSPEEKAKNESFYKQCEEALTQRRKENCWS